MLRSNGKQREFHAYTCADLQNGRTRTHVEQIKRVRHLKHISSTTWKQYAKSCKRKKTKVCQYTFVVYMLLQGKNEKLIKSFTPKNMSKRLNNIKNTGKDECIQQWAHYKCPIQLFTHMYYVLSNPPIMPEDGDITWFLYKCKNYSDILRTVHGNLSMRLSKSEWDHIAHKIERILSYFKQDAITHGTGLHISNKG